MRNYEYSIEPKIVFGLNSIDRIAEFIENISDKKNVAIISDPGGWIEPILRRITDNLNTRGFQLTGKFNQISPNPKKSECINGIELLKSCDCNIFIAVGGGSTIDASKFIIKNMGCEAFIAIPTTAGTGSEMNEWAVITEDETHVKVSLRCKAPDIALLDPVVTVSVPPMVSLHTGMDALSHGIEAIMSKTSTTITDLLAYEGCRKILNNIEEVVENGNNLVARSCLLEGSMMTGIAMANGGLGMVHAIANILPGFWEGVSHGEICSKLLVPVVEYNRNAIDFNKYIKVYPMAQKAELIMKKFEEKFNFLEMDLDKEIVSKVVPLCVMNINAESNPEKIDEVHLEKVIKTAFNVV